MNAAAEMRARLLTLRRELNKVVFDLGTFGHSGRIAAEHLDDAFDGIAGALRQFPAPVDERDDDEPAPSIGPEEQG